MSATGRAATAMVRPAAPEEMTPALAVRHSVEMIDEAEPGDLGVIVMEGSLDVAAISGLMGTAAKSRGMVDGAVHDVVEAHIDPFHEREGIGEKRLRFARPKEEVILDSPHAGPHAHRGLDRRRGSAA